MMKRTLVLCLVVSLLVAPCITEAQPPHVGAQATFNQLVDSYFDFFFQMSPTAATQAGFHQYDAKLEDFSQSGIQAETEGLTRFRKKFAEINKDGLTEIAAGDLDVLISTIDSRLLE